jgi:hypothetical protein
MHITTDIKTSNAGAVPVVAVERELLKELGAALLLVARHDAGMFACAMGDKDPLIFLGHHKGIKAANARAIGIVEDLLNSDKD